MKEGAALLRPDPSPLPLSASTLPPRRGGGAVAQVRRPNQQHYGRVQGEGRRRTRRRAPPSQRGVPAAATRRRRWARGERRRRQAAHETPPDRAEARRRPSSSPRRRPRSTTSTFQRSLHSTDPTRLHLASALPRSPSTCVGRCCCPLSSPSPCYRRELYAADDPSYSSPRSFPVPVFRLQGPDAPAPHLANRRRPLGRLPGQNLGLASPRRCLTSPWPHPARAHALLSKAGPFCPLCTCTPRCCLAWPRTQPRCSVRTR